MNTSKLTLIVGHILIWLLNYWLVAVGSDFNWNGFSASDESLTYAYTYGILFNAILFYSQVFWLYPLIYPLKNKAIYYILTIVVIIIISIIESYCDSIVYNIYKIDKPYLCGFISSLMVHLVYVIAGFYYALKLEFRKSEKLKQKLIEETYKTELKYLKAQLNPHFLFNGINNIYHLIGKNNSLAKETLHQFSDLLRYQLYESNSHILLEKELDYVLKYIKIEETRRGTDVRLDYDIKLENPTLKIAPLLLIPFIENAFKHCSNHIDSDSNTIKINISEVDGTLLLMVVNSYERLINENRVGGIGLNNVQKRLTLLYPNKHQLNITKEEVNHIVNLSINL
ncbi:Histidine kinase [Aquimarina amphilecti]|uniref:Histidine kinase n=1 Tax=Aquimarina amphilecti TaxID=1038014 RepID=A0A1H7HIE3_AQUAM|nr:histidine kinase [Aquimarina amphilecti]SEK47995.1 Histidine kinase [Aquimarina amphilecti]